MVHERVMAEQFRRLGAPGHAEVFRLRLGAFQLGGYLGLDMRAVVQFSEAVIGRRWGRFSNADLERVVADFAQLNSRVRRQWTDVVTPQPDLAERTGRLG